MKELPKFSAKQFITLKPCKQYPYQKIDYLWQRKELTAINILSLPIPIEDRLWAVLSLNTLPEKNKNELFLLLKTNISNLKEPIKDLWSLSVSLATIKAQKAYTASCSSSIADIIYQQEREKQLNQILAYLQT